MALVTFSIVEKFNPCSERLSAAKRHYRGKSFTVKQFLSLKKLNYYDKIWVAFHLMPQKNLRFVIGEAAKSMLHIYESEFPGDFRPRNAIKEATRKKVNVDKVKIADDDAVSAAINAAASGRGQAAYAARDASYAAFLANDTNTIHRYVYFLAGLDTAGVKGRKAQEKINLKIIAKYWRK